MTNSDGSGFSKLTVERDSLAEQAGPIAKQFSAKMKNRKLFEKKTTCRACLNGKKKKLTCAECQGLGQWLTFAFNLGAEKQVKDLLYNGLKLPKRTREGKLSSDEEALQSLLADDTSGFVKLALRYAKLKTIRGIY